MRGTTTVGVPSAADSITSDGSGGTISKPGLRAFTHRVSYACARAQAKHATGGHGRGTAEGGSGVGGEAGKGEAAEAAPEAGRVTRIGERHWCCLEGQRRGSTTKERPWTGRVHG